MKIHSNTLDALEIRKAARVAGVGFTRFDLKGSRKRAQGFDVILTGDSPRRQNQGEDMAATWDQWGHFLGMLFAVDAEMVTPYYENAEHFHWMTGGRFQDFDRASDHVKGHRWGYSGESVTGAYHVSACQTEGCSAVQRWLSAGSWAEFVAQHA
jgi:hypothetical protein